MSKKVQINQNECIGCKVCAELCPAVFHINENEKAEVIETYKIEEAEESKIQEVIESCPVSCISWQVS